MNVQECVLIVLGIWVLLLTLGSFWILSYFRNLSKGFKKGNLIKILERVLTKQEDVSKSLSAVQKKVDGFETQGKLHIQKVGLVRFNPFKEMGGDHSFVLALLDGKETGFIVTGLHTRERTRIYLKEIKKGKADMELSSEEKKALNLAQKS